jgi:hypothetical protein
MSRSIALVLLFGLRTAQCAACTAWERLPVKLFNDGAVGNEVLHPAKEDTAWLLKLVCVDVVWVPCAVVSRLNLTPCKAPDRAIELHILASPATNDFSEDTLGIAMPHVGSRDHAGVFLSRVRQTVASNVGIIDVPALLGYVMAHEIGHLLLHSTVHSSDGLMRADLRQADLKKAAQRQLKFTPEQGEAIRRNTLAPEPSADCGCFTEVPFECTERRWLGCHIRGYHVTSKWQNLRFRWAAYR